MHFLDEGMQMFDPALLKAHLAETLFYEHIQPPFFNALVALVLKALPQRVHEYMVFALFYEVLGILLVLGIFTLSLSIGASRRWSLAAAAIFIFWPPVIFEEFFHHPSPEKWLSYDYPVMFFVLGMALCLALYQKGGRARWVTAFLALSATVVLTRPFFHPLLWFIPVAAIALWSIRDESPVVRRKMAVTAAIFFCVALAPAMKNYYLYGWFTESSLQGMNLASRTLFVDKERIAGEIEAGTVSSLALIPRFSEPEVYIRYYGGVSPTGIELLDRLDRSTGYPNWNHAVMLRASREYQANTMALLSAYPLELVKTTANGVYIFFGFEPNQFLWPMGTVPWGFWDVTFPTVDPKGVYGIFRYLAAPLFFGIVFFTVLIFLFRGRKEPATLFMVFAMIYVFVMANLGELGHNCILRKQIDPLLFAGTALWLTRIVPSGFISGTKLNERAKAIEAPDAGQVGVEANPIVTPLP
jgi:hypothetical protein